MLVALVVFLLLARPTPVPTKYHIPRSILDATALFVPSRPLQKLRLFRELSVYSRNILRQAGPVGVLPCARLDWRSSLPAVGPSRYSSRSTSTCPKSFSVPMVFAASPAHRRWTTPPCTPPAVRWVAISSKPAPPRTYS